MNEKLNLSGFLKDFLDLTQNLEITDKLPTTIKDLSGKSRKVSFQTIPDLMDKEKEYLKIDIEGTWIGIEKRPFIQYLKEIRAYVEGLKKEEEPFQFFLYIESQPWMDWVVFTWGYPEKYNSKSFPIVFTQDTLNKMNELLNSLKDSSNSDQK